jgi:hypothetical protein
VALGHGEAAGSPEFRRSGGRGRLGTGGGRPVGRLDPIATLSLGRGGAGGPARWSQAAAGTAAGTLWRGEAMSGRAWQPELPRVLGEALE